MQHWVDWNQVRGDSDMRQWLQRLDFQATLAFGLTTRPRRSQGASLFVVGAFLLAAGGACGSAAPGPSPAVDQDFDVAAGRSVKIEGTDLVIRFESVLNDSRCPVDVQCIIAGDAAIAVTAATGGAAASRYELHTEEGPREARHGQYRIILIDLKPRPSSAGSAGTRNYIVTLRVGRS
jgi:hypothetical protein